MSNVKHDDCHCEYCNPFSPRNLSPSPDLGGLILRLEQLVAKWRGEGEIPNGADDYYDDYYAGQRWAEIRCADELLAVLRQISAPAETPK